VRKLVVNVGSTLLILFIILTSCRPQGMIPITGNEETTEPVAQQLEDVTPTPETSLAATTEGTVSQTAEIPVLTPTVEPEIISIESPTVVLTVTDTPTSKNTTDIPTETNITITPSVQVPETQGLLQSASASLLWKADFETGNLSQYESYGGFVRRNPTDSYTISKAYAHQGNFAAALTIDTTKPSPSGEYAAFLFLWNQLLLEGDNYYSAWYYIPQEISTRYWWNIWQWKSTYDGNSDHSQPMFCLDVVKGSSGLDIRLFYRPDLEFPQKKMFTQTIKKVPTNQWFHLEGYYRRGQNNDGEVVIWLDGVEIFHVSGYPTVLSDNTLYWSLNHYTDWIQPNPFTIYVDDVALSKTRLGPSVMTTTLSSQKVPLNQPAGALIGEFQTIFSGEPQGTNYTYQLVQGSGGEDNAYFKIESNQLLTNGVIGSQEKTSFAILVRTEDNAGHHITTPFVLDIIPPPAAPQLIAPQGNVTNTRQPVFQWRQVNGATSYFLHVYRSSTTSPFEQEVVPNCQNSVCSFTLPFLLTDGIYQFRVKAKNISGWGEFSAWKVFSIKLKGNKLKSPTLLSPNGLINTDLPQYSWQAVEGAKGYAISIIDYLQRKVLWVNSVPVQCNETICTYSQPTPLGAGSYGFKVKALGENGNDSTFSAVKNFIVRPPQRPVILVSPNAQSGSRPVFTWQPVPRASRYYLLVYQANNGRFPIRTVITPAAAGCSSGTVPCRYTAPLALSNGLYMFKVRAYSEGKWGPYSDYMNFSVVQ